jgi:AHBA synthesis associated protein
MRKCQLKTDTNSPVSAILFDMDGVLINSMPVMRQAFFAALSDVYPDHLFDLNALFFEYRKYLGMGFPQIMQQLGLSSELYQPFRRHSRKLAREVTLYPGIKSLLEKSAEHQLAMGIATGKDDERTRELLRLHDLEHYFRQVYASDTIARPKPAPDMANAFCHDNQLKPEQVLFIGDAWVDIQCGQAAGCQTGLALWGYGLDNRVSRLAPDYQFASPFDVLQQIPIQGKYGAEGDMIC